MDNHSGRALSGVTHNTTRYLYRNMGQYTPLFIAAAVSYWLIDAAALNFGMVDGSPSGGAFSTASPWSFLSSSLVYALISAAIAVPVHNQILNGPFQKQAFVAPNTLVYWFLESVGYLLIFASLFTLTNITTGTTVHIDSDGVEQVTQDAWWQSVGQVGVIVGGFLAAFYLSIRMVTLLPHVAVTKVSAIRWKWALSLSIGHVWGIMLRFMAVGLLMSLPGFLYSFAFELWNPSDAHGAARIVDYLFFAINAIASSATVLFCVSLASFIFLKLSQTGDESQQG